MAAMTDRAPKRKGDHEPAATPFTTRLGVWTFTRPRAVLSAVLGLTTLWFIAAPPLLIDTDLTALLDEDAPAVRSLRQLEQDVGGMGYVTVVAEGGAPDTLIAYAEALFESLKALTRVRSVTVKRPAAFFEEHALLYVEQDRLSAFAERLDERIAYEKRTRSPFYVDLEDAEPPELHADRLRPPATAYSESAGADTRTENEQTYFLDEAAGRIVIFARPDGFASDVAFAEAVVSDVRTRATTLAEERFPELSVRFTGRFTKRVDQNNQFQSEISGASLWAFVLVLAFVVLYYRRGWSVVLLFGPLVVGLLWTRLFAGLALGSLNILTGLIFGILTGLGIDYGIHILDGFAHRYHQQASPAAAIADTYRETARAVILSAVTTVAGFSGLALSGFRGFHEFGLVSAVGIVLLALSYLVLLPPLIALACARGFRPHVPRDASAPAARFFTRFARPLLAASLVAMAICVFAAGKVRFDYDTGTIQGGTLPSFALNDEVDALVGHRQVPTLVFAPDLSQERAVADALRRGIDARGDASWIDFVVAQEDLVPGDQAEKLPILERIAARAREALAYADAKNDIEALQRLERLAEVRPFTAEALPRDLRTQFGWDTKDSGKARLILAFPSGTLTDGLEVVGFTAQIRAAIDEAEKDAHAASESVVFADVLSLIFEEMTGIGVYTVLAILLALAFSLRSACRGLLAMLAPAATIALLTGVMALLGLPFNYLNVMLVPIIVGVGVDGGIHLLEGFREHGDLQATLNQQGRAILSAVTTTGLSFAPLALVEHPGLRSIGQVATLGLFCNACVCLCVMPIWLVSARPKARSHDR